MDRHGRPAGTVFQWETHDGDGVVRLIRRGDSVWLNAEDGDGEITSVLLTPEVMRNLGGALMSESGK